jgi:hypothetical protein
MLLQGNPEMRYSRSGFFKSNTAIGRFGENPGIFSLQGLISRDVSASGAASFARKPDRSGSDNARRTLVSVTDRSCSFRCEALMPNLLENLKDDHRQILGILSEVKKLGIGSRAGREKLLAAKALLLSHIRKEDELFYPALHQEAERNDGLKHTLKYFFDDMEQVSRKAMDLFDKYAGDAFADEFAGEIKLLYMMLKDRIRTEEEVLFKKYEQLGREEEHKRGD